VSLDMNFLSREFYAILGWDPATGGPTKDKLKELGIDDLFA
jgi:aldehyde:ferredoxin oxidoreductase